jgi:heptosyltransferase-2
MTPVRLLVRMPNWLGDVIMALPALRAAREHWPDAHLAVAAPWPMLPLLTAFPGVAEGVPLLARSWRDAESFRQDVDAVRRGTFDVALLFTNSFASARVMRRAGVPQRWGYASDLRTPLLTRAVKKSRARDRGRHHSDYYARLVQALGCAPPAAISRLPVPAEWFAAGDRVLADAGAAPSDRLIAFAPGAAYGQAKQWPPALVARAMAACAHELSATCLVVGAESDRPTAHSVLQEMTRDLPRGAGVPAAPFVDLVGRTDLPTLAGVLARSRAIVSNDSGPMHLASAVGTPVVATFGATDELATSPLGPHTIVAGHAWCRPCLRRECPIDHRCMWSIDPGRVVAAVAELVGSRGRM